MIGPLTGPSLAIAWPGAGFRRSGGPRPSPAGEASGRPRVSFDVKRIQLRRDGTPVLKSDNPHYDEEQVPPEEASEVRITGRAQWFGRTI